MNKNIFQRAIRLLIATSMVASIAMFAIAGSDEQGADAPSSHDIQEHLAQLTQMCESSAEAMAARQAETPLYDRLGGYEKISALTTEIVKLHQQNEAIKHLMDGVDGEALARHVADFFAAGTGGPQKYTGRDMVSAHKDMGLTDADFLAAGGDIVKAMKSFDYGEEEVHEVMCIMVSLKDQVVQN